MEGLIPPHRSVDIKIAVLLQKFYIFGRSVARTYVQPELCVPNNFQEKQQIILSILWKGPTNFAVTLIQALLA